MASRCELLDAGLVKVLVLGGYGAVGSHLVGLLRDGGIEALAAGRDPSRADLVVDLTDPASYRAALPGMDVVVNAAGAEDPALAEVATAHGSAFVDITATSEYVARLEQLSPARPVLLSVGLAPGLTNLLARAVHDQAPGPIDLAVVLGAGERHGIAATDWSYQLLGKRFADEEGPVRNYTRAEIFELPGLGRRRLYRLDFSDQHTMSRDLGTRVRTYFAVDSRALTAGLAALTWLPGGSKMPRGLHPPGSDAWLLLARGSGGTRWARGHNQSRGTAVLTAAAVRAVGGLEPGVHHLHRVLTPADLPENSGIEFGAN